MLNVDNVLPKTKMPLECANFKCNTPSEPGKITQRSCAYYGARWMLAPLTEAAHIVHGHIGCAFYGANVRGKSYKVFSTDLHEKEVIFGGLAKLEQTILEVNALCPKVPCIFVYVTCAPGLTGEDVFGLCNLMTEKLNKPVIAIDCPGFKGASQSDGHKVAYENIFKFLVGKKSLPRKSAKPLVNIIGDYNINGESQVLIRLLAKIGIDVHCIFTGKADLEKIMTSAGVDLNLLICQSSGKLLAQKMKQKYKIPFIKANFFGLSKTCASLRKLAEYFELESKAEQVIAKELKLAKEKAEPYLRKLRGKKAGLFFGAARMGMLINVLEQDMGMKVIFTGSQFGDFNTYADAWENAKDGTYFVDDASEDQLEELLLHLQPDVFMGGIKENFLAHKLKTGFVLFPQPKQCGVYVGFEGFPNFVKNVYNAVFGPVWRFEEL